MLKGENIICVASSSWDAMWVNSQHLMYRLGRDNNVLYLNNTGLRVPSVNRTDIAKVLERIRLWLKGVSRQGENVFVLSPIIVPFHGSALIRRLNNAILTGSIRRWQRRLGLSDPILWTFLPTGGGLVGRLGEKLSIYHCVDEYTANPGVSSVKIDSIEKDLLARADLVFVTSKRLFEEKRGYNERTHYFGNVANVSHFMRVLEDGDGLPEDLAAIPRPIIGYQGNISSYKTDLSLIEQIARADPGWSVVLVGPVGWGDPGTDVSRLKALGNVHFLGRKDYDQLPRYVKGFDVCIIPFVRNQSTDSSFPMKFFEYLAMGKPIVASNLSSLAPFRENEAICRLAEGPEDFVEKIRATLAETPDDAVRNQRIEFARKNDWEVRIQEIGEVVQKALERDGRP